MPFHFLINVHVICLFFLVKDVSVSLGKSAVRLRDVLIGDIYPRDKWGGVENMRSYFLFLLKH